jgi:hypothetical protein
VSPLRNTRWRIRDSPNAPVANLDCTVTVDTARVMSSVIVSAVGVMVSISREVIVDAENVMFSVIVEAARVASWVIRTLHQVREREKAIF